MGGWIPDFYYRIPASCLPVVNLSYFVIIWQGGGMGEGFGLKLSVPNQADGFWALWKRETVTIGNRLKPFKTIASSLKLLGRLKHSSSFTNVEKSSSWQHLHTISIAKKQISLQLLPVSQLSSGFVFGAWKTQSGAYGHFCLQVIGKLLIWKKISTRKCSVGGDKNRHWSFS